MEINQKQKNIQILHDDFRAGFSISLPQKPSYSDGEISDIIEQLHTNQTIDQNIEPNKGQRGLLCSNNDPIRCPLVGLINEEDQTLDSLALILAEAFIKKKKNEFKNNK